jgi:hypothetical protein
MQTFVLQLTALVLLLVPACAMSFESYSLTSIEWLVDASDDIHIARLDADLEPGITETLKGTDRNFTLARSLAENERRYRWKAKGSVLLFCRVIEDKPIAFYSIVLGAERDKIGHDVCDKSGRFFKDRASLLEAIKARLKLAKELPKGSEIFLGAPARNHVPLGFLMVHPPKAEYVGANCLGVKVPADPEYKAQLIEQLGSKFVHDRALGAAGLVNYPDNDVIARLKKCLLDPDTHTRTFRKGGQPEGKVIYYPVRQAAYEALTLLKVTVEKPEGLDEEYRHDFW